MKRFFILTASFIFYLLGCDNGVDKSLVDNSVKLNSPYSDFALYRYHVESSMAFGSGFTVVKILPTRDECDYTDRDFFRFGNNYPLLIKWKNKDTLSVKCIGEGSLADQQPIKTEFQKWKNWTFEVQYYTIFSSSGHGNDTVQSYELQPNSISFKTRDRLLVFNISEVALELDSNQISMRTFKVDTFKSKTGLSLEDYDLKMNENYVPKDFYGVQPFIKTKP